MTIKFQKLAAAGLLAGVSVTLLALPTLGWTKDPRINNTIIVKKHKRFEHRNPPHGYGPSHYGRGHLDNNPRPGFGYRSNPYGYGYDYRGRPAPNHYSDRIPRRYPPYRQEYEYDRRYQSPGTNTTPRVQRRSFGVGGNYRNR